MEKTLYRKGDPVPASIIKITPSEQQNEITFGVDAEFYEQDGKTFLDAVAEHKPPDAVFVCAGLGLTIQGQVTAINCKGAAAFNFL